MRISSKSSKQDRPRLIRISNDEQVEGCFSGTVRRDIRFTRSSTFEFVEKKAIYRFLSSLRARFITNTGIVGTELLMEERRSSILNSSMWRHAPEYRRNIVSLSRVRSLYVSFL